MERALERSAWKTTRHLRRFSHLGRAVLQISALASEQSMKVLGFSAILLAIVSDCGAAPTPARTPTYYRDVAPLIYQNCSTCHRPGESGPFSLLSYEDVKHHATQIASVTRTR